MKHKRKVSFFIIITAVLMVCSVSVLAVSVRPSQLYIEISAGDADSAPTYIQDTVSDQSYSFLGVSMASGDIWFDTYYTLPAQSFTDATLSLYGKFGYKASEWKYVERIAVPAVSIYYADGTKLYYTEDSYAWDWGHSTDGTYFYLDYAVAGLPLTRVNEIIKIQVHLLAVNVGNGSDAELIIYTRLGNFSVSFDDIPVSPSDEIFNDFSGFGDDADAVDGSEQQIKDEISNYQPEVDSFLNGFSTIVGELTVPLRAVTLMINDYVSGVPFLELLLRFSLSLGVILLLFGLGSVVVSGVSSGVRSAHREADRAKEAAERSADRREIMRMRREEHDIRMDHYRR